MAHTAHPRHRRTPTGPRPGVALTSQSGAWNRQGGSPSRCPSSQAAGGSRGLSGSGGCAAGSRLHSLPVRRMWWCPGRRPGSEGYVQLRDRRASGREGVAVCVWLSWWSGHGVSMATCWPWAGRAPGLPATHWQLFGLQREPRPRRRFLLSRWRGLGRARPQLAAATAQESAAAAIPAWPVSPAVIYQPSVKNSC